MKHELHTIRKTMNKSLYTFLVALLLTASAFLPQQASAQAPDKMSYQAVVRDDSSALITNSPIGLQLSILQGSATGTAVYTETQTPVTNENGLLTIEIGTGTVVSGDFTTIDWSAGTFFIKTETDPTGGSNYTITGTSQLLSVPYALYAKSSGNTAIPEGSNPNDILIWSGTEWSLLPAGEEGSILKIVDGAPNWVEEPAGTVQFGFDDVFNNLEIDFNQLLSDRARFRIRIGYDYTLDPNVTSIRLLISTVSNPIPSNSEALEINLQDLNNYSYGVEALSTNLVVDTTYYYRLIINGEFVDGNVYPFRTPPVALGESFQGGILAYTYQPNEDGYVEGAVHGFVVAEAALTDAAPWGCEGTNLPGMVTGGFANTTAAQNSAIINGCEEANIAARVVDNLSINGYNDWLLPSKDLINNGIRNSAVLSQLSGIVDGYYWSCTPHVDNTAQSAWATHINNGSNIQADKSNLYYIIPVREF
ncbi:hypothetical protein ACFSQP_08735 [Bizionia sediminis]|uniref:DUF1566 domain-containing protein n=1 Tax=Bizionia sediminis TaxID=1737064 RepID=A0ABW5KVB5_9FLAO